MSNRKTKHLSRKVCLCRHEARLTDVIVVCVHRDAVCELRFRLTVYRWRLLHVPLTMYLIRVVLLIHEAYFGNEQTCLIGISVRYAQKHGMKFHQCD